MVGDIDPDGEVALQGGCRGRGDSLLLQVHDDLAIDGLQLLFGFAEGRISEANDVQGHRRRKFQLRVRFDFLGQIGGLAAIVLDLLGDAPNAMLLERKPDFERTEPPRQFRAIFAGPGIPTRQATRRRGQVFAPEREGLSMQILAPDQNGRGIVLDMHPLVEIEGDRIRTLDSLQPRPQFLAERGDRPEGTVDMEPEAELLADIRDGVEIIHGSRIDGGGRADDAERAVAGIDISEDRPAQRGRVHTVMVVDGNDAKGVLADPHVIEGTGDTAMRFLRRVADQPVLFRLHTLMTDVVTRLCVACSRQSDEGCHRSPAHHQAAGGVGKVEQHPAPVDDLTLDIDGAVVAPAEVGVHGRRERVGNDCARCAGAMHPAEEPRMRVARRIGQDEPDEVVTDFLGTLRLYRQCLGERLLHVVGHRGPDRPVADAFGIIERDIEHAMGKRPKFGPIGGIERTRLVGNRQQLLCHRSLHWHSPGLQSE